MSGKSNVSKILLERKDVQIIVCEQPKLYDLFGDGNPKPLIPMETDPAPFDEKMLTEILNVLNKMLLKKVNKIK